jgi:hypothetical protein
MMIEEEANILESLLENAEEYSKTSLELLKLKALEKTSDIVSSLIPHLAVSFFAVLFLIMISIGTAIWLGEILGNSYYGFFCVAGFYGLIGIILHFFLHDWLKKVIGNFTIKQVLK